MPKEPEDHCDWDDDEVVITDDEEYEERAAIMEYDGGLSREEAETAARLVRRYPDDGND